MIIIQAVSYTQMTVMDAYGIRENDFVLSYEMMIQNELEVKTPKVIQKQSVIWIVDDGVYHSLLSFQTAEK